MEEYTSTTFIAKARLYLGKSPPDLVQSAEKIWFAAVYAVKELYLTCGGIDMKSHNSLAHFCDFAIRNSELTEERREYLWHQCWVKAHKMHQDVYGSGNFRKNQYEQIIKDVEAFVGELANFDFDKLWNDFENTYIHVENPAAKVQPVSRNIKLGGVSYNCDYSAVVP